MDERKRGMRLEINRALSAWTGEALQASNAAVAQRVLASDMYQSADRIFSYFGIRRELSTREIIADAIAQGKTVALPVSGPDKSMAFFRYDGFLETGRYGIPEPVSGQLLVPEENDLILVPGLAFDRHGCRLGKGGGYYDRYLAKHRGVTLGLCRGQFLMPELPRDGNDVPVNYVITETETIRCAQ